MPKPVILAADDSVTIRKLIEISMKDEDIDLHFATEGKECVEKAAALRPSLLLLDYILPDMKGVDVCHALLKRAETRDIPVLLISGNGAAIRQTYENAGNVADYLTKPFAPNVLNAVVGHLLTKTRKKTEDADILRLAPSGSTDAAAPTAIPEKLRAGVVRSLVEALEAPLMAFPGLEAAREGASPAEYFIDFLANSGTVDRLSRFLLSIPELQPPPPALCCASELAPVDRVLGYLDEIRATGRLNLALADETIHVHFDAGNVVFITSTNPKRYCAGAAFPFRSLEPSAIGAAVVAQQADATPFFVTLHQRASLPNGARVDGLLQAQGASALARAITAGSVKMTLEERVQLPASWEPYRQRYSLPGLLFAAYREIDDWLTIEKAIPNLETVFQRSASARHRPGELSLDAGESELLSMLDGRSTVLDLISRSRLRPFDLCRRVFPFVRLGLVEPVRSGRPQPSRAPGTNLHQFLAAT